MYHVNSHQKVTSADEEFDNQVVRMACSMYSQPLSPAIPVFSKVPMYEVAMVALMGVMHGFNNMDFHPPKLTWPQLLLRVKSANSRQQHRAPGMAPFPWVVSQLVVG